MRASFAPSSRASSCSSVQAPDLADAGEAWQARTESAATCNARFAAPRQAPGASSEARGGGRRSSGRYPSGGRSRRSTRRGVDRGHHGRPADTEPGKQLGGGVGVVGSSPVASAACRDKDLAESAESSFFPATTEVSRSGAVSSRPTTSRTKMQTGGRSGSWRTAQRFQVSRFGHERHAAGLWAWVATSDVIGSPTLVRLCDAAIHSPDGKGRSRRSAAH